MNRRLVWKDKKKFKEFFDYEQVPKLQAHHRKAMEFLVNSSRFRAVSSGILSTVKQLKYAIFIFVAILSVIANVVSNYLSYSHLPYQPIANGMECAWYFGESNLDTTKFFGVPYALPPKSVKYEDNHFAEIAKKLLRRWKLTEKVEGLERCILAHQSSNCKFSKGTHKCFVKAHPRFCKHYRVTNLRQSKKPAFKNPDTNNSASSGDSSMEEDCLFLSISRPKDYKSDYPIIVFVTGSGYVSDTTWTVGQDSPLHADESLAHVLQAVVVRVNYRLGYYGTFKDGPNGKIVNFGLSDIITSLEFLKKVAKNFGGDPDRISIVGHGSGAAMVMAVLAWQKRNGTRLVQAAWLSSGPSRIPSDRKIFDHAVSQIVRPGWDKLAIKDEDELYDILLTQPDSFRCWTQTGFLMNQDEDIKKLTKVKGGAAAERCDWELEWLAPDGKFLHRSPTEGDAIFDWADVPVVFANVGAHLEGFPGFLLGQGWSQNWDKILEKFHAKKLSGDPAKFKDWLKKVYGPMTDHHNLVIGAMAASWLIYICPYRHLAKKLASSPSRNSKVFHFVMNYALKYPAEFLRIGDNRPLNGPFYGLDLLLLLGTAPQVVDTWDRRDQAVMKHLQDALMKFAHKQQLPSSWLATDAAGSYTIFGNTDSTITSAGITAANQFCDSMPFDQFANLRSQL